MHMMLGLNGVAVALTVSDMISVIIAIILLFIQYWHLRKETPLQKDI